MVNLTQSLQKPIHMTICIKSRFYFSAEKLNLKKKNNLLSNRLTKATDNKNIIILRDIHDINSFITIEVFVIGVWFFIQQLKHL